MNQLGTIEPRRASLGSRRAFETVPRPAARRLAVNNQAVPACAHCRAAAGRLPPQQPLVGAAAGGAPPTAAACARRQQLKLGQQQRNVSARASSSLSEQLLGPSTTRQTSDTWLGALALRLLPGPLYYVPSLALPLAALAGGVLAVHAPTILAALAGVQAIQGVTWLSPLLQAAANTKLAATTVSILASLAAVYVAFLVIPALDFLLGKDLRNPRPKERAAAGRRATPTAAIHRAVLHAYVPVHLGMLASLCWLVSSHAVHPLAFLGAIASAGAAGGVLFSAAHELLHGHSWDERLLTSAALASVCYMHWGLSHLAHHVKVATPEDPASARRGESLYAFLPRSIWGNLVDGYSMEAQRLKAHGTPFFSPQNSMLYWVACPAALAAASWAMGGPAGLAFFLGQALVSILLLETVNYIEHFGLVRRRRQDGRYEKVGPQHSWNANTMATSAISFRLQRHADHHRDASRPFHLLRDLPESPQLPASYPVMMMLALIPPAWFAVMEPRVDALQHGLEQSRAMPLPCA